MSGDIELLLPILLPIAAAVCLLWVKEKQQSWYLCGVMGLEVVVVLFLVAAEERTLTFWHISDTVKILWKTDGVARFFACLMSGIWFLAVIYSQEYMKHEENIKRFFLFYLLTLSALMGLSFAGNLLTLYVFYEMMTLCSVPFVIHSGSTEAMKAGMKYLGYSIFGAGLVLAGFFFLEQYCVTTDFVAGGTLDSGKMAGKETLLLCVFLSMAIGFGGKAGMFPLHGWLPTAHPVAPSPASAVLSGIITKAGILGILRVSYYLFGVSFLAGTWAQKVVLCLAIFTIFMGSMLAYKEKLMKKRFAYSTVSQVSYVIFGLLLFSPIGFCGALLQIVFHAVTKNILFFTAGAIIYKTGKTYVTELKGIGKEMPIVLWCFTLGGLSLIGIPPFGGFVSKWFLAQGALTPEYGILGIVGVVVLMVSALLTAGYVLPMTADAFFPGRAEEYYHREKKEPKGWMTVPLVILAAMTLLWGILPNGLLQHITEISNTIFVAS